MIRINRPGSRGGALTWVKARASSLVSQALADAAQGLRRHAQVVGQVALLHPLGMLGPENEQVFARLVELLADPDPDVRYAAPRGLGYFGDRAIPHLEKLLAKHGETGRAAIQGKGPCINVVCETLAAIGTRKAHRALKKAAASGRARKEMPAAAEFLMRAN